MKYRRYVGYSAFFNNNYLNMETNPSKLAICAAAYYIMASGELLKNNDKKDKLTRKRRRYWVNEYYKSRNK